MRYESYEIVHSTLREGVTYTVNRMSFGRRVELMRKVRELAPRLEYFQAGAKQEDRLEAHILSAEIDKLYLEWGLKKIDGLEIDGCKAEPTTLIVSGPEDLFAEALQYVKKACQLSEPEIKN